ncbi:hypothetical protein [Clostridium perfringens]|uniref:hypothetical protein n=1 Tax=Clostridium perfringens TaxID=1502 RepID=UPI001094CDB3|nr:hypothetical protein [Clostridium perfringens]TGY46746.1 hypothetical protein E5346_03650 [Clostridium perfringens]
MELSIFLPMAITAGAIAISNITVANINVNYDKNLEKTGELMTNILGNKNTSKEIKLQAIKVLKEIN